MMMMVSRDKSIETPRFESVKRVWMMIKRRSLPIEKFRTMAV